MNKEKIITVIIGISVGLLIAVGYFAFSKYKKSPIRPEKIQTVEEKPVVSGVTNIQLELDQPNDRSSTTSAVVSLSGKTIAGAIIFVLANMDEKIASADAMGNFETEIKLEEGENEISTTAFSNGVNSSVVRRNVTLEINAQ